MQRLIAMSIHHALGIIDMRMMECGVVALLTQQKVYIVEQYCTKKVTDFSNRYDVLLYYINFGGYGTLISSNAFYYSM